MEGYVCGWKEGREMDEWMEGWTGEWMEGHRGEWMDEGMDRGTGEEMEGRST